MDLFFYFISTSFYNARLFFFIGFYIYRKISGGYHAETYAKCHLLFGFNQILFLLLLFYIPVIYRYIIFFIIIFISIIITFFMAPIDHPNKQFDSKEYHKYKKMSRLLAFLLIPFGITVYLLDKNNTFCFCFGIGIFSASVSLLYSRQIDVYRRVTWSKKGKKKIVWRCCSRLDFGTKYCTESLTVEETSLKQAVVKAINKFNEEDAATYLMLMRSSIGDAIGLNGGSDEIDLLERRIDALNKKILILVNKSVQNGEDIESNEDEFKEISEQIDQLRRRITAIRESQQENGKLQERLEEIQATIDERENHREEYDESIVRQMIECIKVFKDGKLLVIFGGGYEVEVLLQDTE